MSTYMVNVRETFVYYGCVEADNVESATSAFLDEVRSGTQAAAVHEIDSSAGEGIEEEGDGD